MIEISAIHFDHDVEQLVLDVLRSGRLAQGPMVEELEITFAAALGVEHCIAVNNGTTALVASILALDLEPGDEVITTAFSFVATLNSIIEAGATARFCDVGDDFCMDPEALEELIGPRTRAIMPVHLYGLPADMDAIASIAQRHGLTIVEDAAQAHGASVGGRHVGSWGLGCFSLYATKNVTSGEGGLITTNDAALADRLCLMRNQGMRARYEYVVMGHNYRMTEVQAAIAIPQVRRLDEITAQRRANAARLTKSIGEVEGLVLPTEPERRSHVWHQYTVRVTTAATCDRTELAARLRSAGVGSGIYYPRTMYDYDCYRGHPLVSADATPRAEAIAAEVLSLPVHPLLSDDDIDTIADAVRVALA